MNSRKWEKVSILPEYEEPDAVLTLTVFVPSTWPFKSFKLFLGFLLASANGDGDVGEEKEVASIDLGRKFFDGVADFVWLHLKFSSKSFENELGVFSSESFFFMREEATVFFSCLKDRSEKCKTLSEKVESLWLKLASDDRFTLGIDLLVALLIDSINAKEKRR